MSCSAGTTECQPALLSWSGGEPPYFLTVQSTKGSHVYLRDSDTSSTSFTWVVNVPAGTAVSAQLKDSTGVIANTASFKVAKGTCELLRVFRYIVTDGVIQRPAACRFSNGAYLSMYLNDVIEYLHEDGRVYQKVLPSRRAYQRDKAAGVEKAREICRYHWKWMIHGNGAPGRGEGGGQSARGVGSWLPHRLRRPIDSYSSTQAVS
jgi:hypothetical protein